MQFVDPDAERGRRRPRPRQPGPGRRSPTSAGLARSTRRAGAEAVRASWASSAAWRGRARGARSLAQGGGASAALGRPGSGTTTRGSPRGPREARTTSTAWSEALRTAERLGERLERAARTPGRKRRPRRGCSRCASTCSSGRWRASSRTPRTSCSLRIHPSGDDGEHPFEDQLVAMYAGGESTAGCLSSGFRRRLARAAAGRPRSRHDARARARAARLRGPQEEHERAVAASVEVAAGPLDGRRARPDRRRRGLPRRGAGGTTVVRRYRAGRLRSCATPCAAIGPAAWTGSSRAISTCSERLYRVRPCASSCARSSTASSSRSSSRTGSASRASSSPPATTSRRPSTGSCSRSGRASTGGSRPACRCRCKPGDHVVFPASAGAWVEVEEEKLLVCRVGELLGVLEEIERLPAVRRATACAGRRLPGLRPDRCGGIAQPGSRLRDPSRSRPRRGGACRPRRSGPRCCGSGCRRSACAS